MKTTLAILIAAFSASCAHQITVKVTDPDGKPIKGALPILQPLFFSPISDRKGRLSVDQRYTYAICAPGYETFPGDYSKHPGRKEFQHQETVILQPEKSR
jgi:hypothetical protein